MRRVIALALLFPAACAAPPPALQAGPAAPPPTGWTRVSVELAPPSQPAALRPESPFGINTAMRPDAPDQEQRLAAMQQAGIKWGRQDFSWGRIETSAGAYDFEGYDRLLDAFTRHGILIFGNLTGAPKFHDPRTPEGVEAYAAFARACVKRYAGRIDHWQIWNEPNGGYWKGSPEEYARLLASSGKAIHGENPKAKVLALNMAFCDVLWAERVMKLVPYDAFDVVCFHPYRAMCAPEEAFDWWELDQYVRSWHKNDLTPQYSLVTMTLEQQTDELVKTMAKFGTPKPLWITEICWNTDIHPYGVPELRSAELLVRFYVAAVASRKIEKAFWWTLKDGGTLQFDKAQQVGLMRADLQPKYSYFAYAVMTRMLEGKRWTRNEAWGPDVYAAVFAADGSDEETMVAWTPNNYAYARIDNTEKGLATYDLYGTKRVVAWDARRTSHCPFPLGQSPQYIVGPKGLHMNVRPNPGW